MIRIKQKVARHAVALLLLGSVVQLLGVGTSYADDTRVRKKFKDTIMVVQPKPFLQRNRVELVPTFRASINDVIVNNMSVGAELNYHILDSLYIGLGFDWGNFGTAFGGVSSVAKDLDRTYGAEANGMKLNYLAFGQVGWTPIMGKFAIFNSAIAYYDLGLAIGGGYLSFSPVLSNKEAKTGGGFIGVNSRLFLNDWLALNFSVRDLIFLGQFNKDEKALTNIVSVGFGVSFYIPFSFKYTEQTSTGEGNSLNLTSDD